MLLGRGNCQEELVWFIGFKIEGGGYVSGLFDIDLVDEDLGLWFSFGKDVEGKKSENMPDGDRGLLLFSFLSWFAKVCWRGIGVRTLEGKGTGRRNSRKRRN